MSVCPVCYKLLPAVIFERDEKIWMRKVCEEHGEFEQLYWGDAEMYYKAMKLEAPPRKPKVVYTDLKLPCPFSCGLCPLHQDNTILGNIVVTNRCDLSCFYCFFYAEKANYVYEPTQEEYRQMLKQLRKQAPIYSMAIQLTGGEPLVREDIVDLIKIAKEEGFYHVQLNTNGIKFAQEGGVELAKKIKEAGVSTIYLSFDGIDPKINFKNHWEIPYMLDAFRKAKINSVVLVPTVIRGWNTHEIGKIVKFAALNNDVIRGVNFQPVSFVGAMPRNEIEKQRITIPEVIKLIEEQTDGQITHDSWYPTPVVDIFTSFIEAFTGEEQQHWTIHPACGMATYAYVDKSGKEVKFAPINEFVDVDALLEYLKKETEEIKKGKNKKLVIVEAIVKFRSFIKKEPKTFSFSKQLYNMFIAKKHNEAIYSFHMNFLYLGMMHFQDPYNYDVQRVMRCGIHYVMPDGRVLPFCTFNVFPDVYRDVVQKKFSYSIEEWKKLHGEDSIGDAIKYRRDIKKLTSGEIYKEIYKPFLNLQ
ncbi:MAG: tetraether lipid synthase Tes [Thermoproteota archaeon]